MCLHAELMHIESHRHDISKGCNQSKGKFIIFRELYSQLDVCFQEPSRPLCSCTLRGIWCIGWGSGNGGCGGRQFARFGREGWGGIDAEVFAIMVFIVRFFLFFLKKAKLPKRVFVSFLRQDNADRTERNVFEAL